MKLVWQVSEEPWLKNFAPQLLAGLDAELHGLARGINLSLISNLSISICALQQLHLCPGTVEFFFQGSQLLEVLLFKLRHLCMFFPELCQCFILCVLQMLPTIQPSTLSRISQEG